LDNNLSVFPQVLDMFCTGYTSTSLLVLLCQSHPTEVSRCINQDRVELMRERNKKLVVVVDERERNKFASLNSINIQNLTDFKLSSEYLDVESKKAILSKNVIFQKY